MNKFWIVSKVTSHEQTDFIFCFSVCILCFKTNVQEAMDKVIYFSEKKSNKSGLSLARKGKNS